MRISLMAAIATVALALSPLAGAQSGKLSSEDSKFFREIAQANLAEVEAGKLAQKQAKNDQVKKFGEHMIEDHGKMLEEQRTLAKSKGIDMPTAPGKSHQAALEKLKDAKGEEFDRAYMSQMVKDHEQTLQLVQEVAKEAKDPELKAMAQKAAPEIQQHLQMAKQLSGDAAAGGTAKRGKDK